MDTDQEVALPALMELVGLLEALEVASLVDTLADLEAAMVVLDGGNSPWGFSTPQTENYSARSKYCITYVFYHRNKYQAQNLFYLYGL